MVNYIRDSEKKSEIHPRKLWANEEYDFSPFVIEHISEIGDIVGMDLEVVQKEAKIGTFELDILCKDTNTNEYVVIENQIEKSNHDHLGKCITYMAGVDAKTCIWINKEFRQEHKDALELLNNATTEDYSFYGINVKTYEYSNGELTYDWECIIAPNSIKKSFNSVKSENALEKKLSMDKFWDLFDMYMSNLTNDMYYNIINTNNTYRKERNWCNIKGIPHKALGGMNLGSGSANNNIVSICVSTLKERNNAAEICDYLNEHSKYNDWAYKDIIPNSNRPVKNVVIYIEKEMTNNMDDNAKWLAEHVIDLHDTLSKL